MLSRQGVSPVEAPFALARPIRAGKLYQQCVGDADAMHDAGDFLADDLTETRIGGQFVNGRSQQLAVTQATCFDRRQIMKRCVDDCAKTRTWRQLPNGRTDEFTDT